MAETSVLSSSKHLVIEYYWMKINSPYRRIFTYLMSRLVVFNILSHCILQSQFQKLFSKFKIGVLLIIGMRLYSNVFKLQSATERRCSRGRRRSLYGNILKNINFFDPSKDSISKLVKFSKSLRINSFSCFMLFNFSSRSLGK